MRDLPLTEEAKQLAPEILFKIRFRDKDPLKDDWRMVAGYHLMSSMRTMTAIHQLICQGALDPARILLRHLFELAVTLLYLGKYPEKRPHFVRYYSRQGVPKAAWRSVRAMCEGLGLEEQHYKVTYRVLSEQSHAGVKGMWKEYLVLLGCEKVQDHETANVLLYAMFYYSWVLAVSRQVFPYLGPCFRFEDWSKRMFVLKAKVEAAYDEQLRDLEARRPSDSAEAST